MSYVVCVAISVILLLSALKNLFNKGLNYLPYPLPFEMVSSEVENSDASCDLRMLTERASVILHPLTFNVIFSSKVLYLVAKYNCG